MNFLILMVIALVVSSIGFYKYVYFISLGYGFSIAAFGIATPLLFKGELSLGTILTSVLFLIYGLRLGGYLLVRELKSASYNATMKKEIKDGSTMKFGVKACIWISCALLYVLQVSPVLFRLENKGGTDVVCIIGIVIMAAAIFGYVCIVYIMFGGARRLELRQNRNYGDDPEYQEYVKKTPILLPFVPLYSVEKYKWLVG